MARSRWNEAVGQRPGSRTPAGLAGVRRSTPRWRHSARPRSGPRTIARELAFGSETEAERRTAHEAARAALTELQLRDARAVSDVGRGRSATGERLEAELAAAEADLARRSGASWPAPVPARDLALSAAVAEAERSLAEALEELGAMRAARQAEGEALAALRRVEAARAAELETARRRLAEAERQAADERAQADEVARRLAEAETACAGPRAALAAAIEEEKAAVAAREAARARARSAAKAPARRRPSAPRPRPARAAGLRGRLDAAGARLAEDEARGIARAARKVGGKPLSEGLEVEAGFRVAVEAALGEAMRGYVVGRDAVPGLRRSARGAGARGGDAVGEGRRGSQSGRAGTDSAEAAEAAAAAAIARVAAGWWMRSASIRAAPRAGCWLGASGCRTSPRP